MVKDATISPKPTLFQKALVDINLPSIKRNPPGKTSRAKTFHLSARTLGKGAGFGLRSKSSKQKLSGGKSLLGLFESAHQGVKIKNPCGERFYSFDIPESPPLSPESPASPESPMVEATPPRGSGVASAFRSLFTYVGLI